VAGLGNAGGDGKETWVSVLLTSKYLISDKGGWWNIPEFPLPTLAAEVATGQINDMDSEGGERQGA